MENNELFKEITNDEAPCKTSYYKLLFKRIITKVSFILPVIILFLIFILGLMINYFVSKDSYMVINFDKAYLPFSAKYLLGTNEYGQDMFYLVFVSSYNTLKLAFIVTFVNLVFGTIIGIIWGHSSKFDTFMIFIKHVLDNIPMIFFFIIIITSLGDGFLSLLFVLTIFGWLNIACLIRNNLVLIRKKDYNIVSKLNKTPFYKIAIYNYLPSLLPIIFNSIAISIPEIISLEITISYFGFSFGNHNTSLGSLLYSSISKNNCFSHPYLFIIPLLFIIVINLCFYYISKTISSSSLKEENKVC